ncbi:MAG: energy transducer TonB [Acidobacteria bacterium]|nr:energy transducer TonB [Acidobacteriota bacterium]
MNRGPELRLLVDWRDEFANVGPRALEPAKPPSPSRAPLLLVDWREPFANIHEVKPGATLPPSAHGKVPPLLVDWADPFSYIPTRLPIVDLPPVDYDVERLQVQWDDELVLGRSRQTVMAAAIVHLLAILIAILTPRVFPRPEMTAEEKAERERTALSLLYIPPEVAEPKPQPDDLTAEERRRAVVRTPITVSPEELERVLPPPPPSGGGIPGLPGAPAEESSPSSPARSERSQQTDRPRQMVRLEDIPQRPEGQGGAGLPLPSGASPGRAIEESLRRAQGGGGGAPGIPGEGYGPMQPNLNVPGPLILSDTRGVDFGPYLANVVREVRMNWYAVMPESVYLGDKGKVVIVFAIQKDGSVPAGQPALVGSSGKIHLDRPALASIRASQPFQPLPKEFDGEQLVLQFTFLYNLPYDYTGP